MNENWANIYRNYSEADLAGEITRLREESENPNNSQTEGDRAYNRSTAEIRDRLEAAYHVQNERRGRNSSRSILPDFSRVRMGG